MNAILAKSLYNLIVLYDLWGLFPLQFKITNKQGTLCKVCNGLDQV